MRPRCENLRLGMKPRLILPVKRYASFIFMGKLVGNMQFGPQVPLATVVAETYLNTGRRLLKIYGSSAKTLRPKVRWLFTLASDPPILNHV